MANDETLNEIERAIIGKPVTPETITEEQRLAYRMSMRDDLLRRSANLVACVRAVNALVQMGMEIEDAAEVIIEARRRAELSSI